MAPLLSGLCGRDISLAMRIGAHESTAGGLHAAIARAEADGCEALQHFTGFPSRWEERELDHEGASLFRSEGARLPHLPLLAHCGYLINLASPEASLWQRSLDALVEELQRCETLGIRAAVLHPGSHRGAGVQAGLRRVARALDEALQRTEGFAVRLLLENTAGQGDCLGYRFEQLGWLLAHTPRGERLGICLDTCHAFVAGYNLAQQRGYDQLLAELERHVGLARLEAFHLNDSRGAAGSRLDRHAQIGEGQIGAPAFARLVNEPCFAEVPALVESPPDPDGRPSFARNVRRLKALRRSAVRSSIPSSTKVATL